MNESPQLSWRKSSYSGGTGGQCVEIASAPGWIWVRDSKDRQGPCLRIRPACFTRWLAGLKAGVPTIVDTCLSVLPEDGLIALRHGRDAGLRFTRAEWTAFQLAVDDGEFDLDQSVAAPPGASSGSCCGR
jgi:hypothetical protein